MMIPVTNTKRLLKQWRLIALLPLSLLLLNFTIDNVIESDQFTSVVEDNQLSTVDPAVVEKEIAPFLKALALNPNDEQSLAFLNKTLVHLTYKYPEEKAGLATVVKQLIKKYNVPVTTEIDGITASIKAMVVKE